MINHIPFGETGEKAKLGDVVHLKNQEQEVVKCEETGVLMLNIDADQLAEGDLSFIRKLGLTISNPDTERPVALSVDKEEGSVGEAVAGFLAGAAASTIFDNDDDDDDDDSSFFHGGSFGGSSSSGGFGGSFGGFSGGGFSGGGASASF